VKRNVEEEAKRILEEAIYGNYDTEIPLDILKYIALKIVGGSLVYSHHWKDFFEAFKLIAKIKGWGEYDEGRKVFILNHNNEEIATIFMRRSASKVVYSVPYKPIVPAPEKEEKDKKS